MSREARPGDDDDDFDDVPSRKSPGSKTGLIVALVVGGALLLLCLPVVGLAAWLFTAARAPVQPANDAELGPAAGDAKKGDATKKVLSRKEFESLVLNKAKDQIIASVGRPDDSTEDVPKPGRGDLSQLAEYWLFRNRVINENTGKAYPIARIHLDQAGQAYKVDYP